MKAITFSAFFLIVLYSSNVFSESYKVKKLKIEISKAVLVDKKLDLLIEIANEIKGSYPDSALYYLRQAEIFTPELKTNNEREIINIKILLCRISVEVAKGNYSESWKLDSLALLKAKSISNRELEGQALMSKGGILYHLSEFDKAQEINREALRLIKTTNDRKTEGKILTNMGTIEFILGYADKADSLFRIPMKLAEEAGDEDLLAASLLNIGLLNIYRGEYKVAEDNLLKSIEVYKSIDGKDGLVLCYQSLSTIYFEQGNMEKSIEFNVMNFNLSMELGDRIGTAKANQNLGECHSQIGDYEKALDFFIKSLNIKMQLNDSKGIATTYSSIGHIHFLLDQFDQALEYYRKSLQTNIEIGYEMGIAAGYGNVGSILFEQNRQDSALYYFEKSAEIYKKNEAINYLANVNLNIGKVHFARKDFINAGKYYHDAEEIKIQLDDKLGIYNTWALFSSLYLEKARSTKTNTVLKNNELKSALDYGKKAYDLSLITKNMPGQHESAGYLKDIYSELGNLAEALKFAQLEMQISDSLSLIQRTDALVNAEIRWKAERKQIEIDRLEKEKSLQEVVILQKSSLANRLIIITLFVLLVLILIIIGSMLFIKNKAKQKAIEYQNHIIEVTRLKMQNINNRLSPHLFFNILSSVSSEAGDAEKVKEKINQAAVLLRTSLENAESNSITLARELEMVKAYVDIQKSRLHETFESSFLISESVDLEMPIPVMILLIPIENSIKHGLMSLDGEKKLIVTIENSNQTVIIKVIDNGIGRKNSKGRTTGTGTGLKVLLQTIRLLNDGNVDKILFNIHDTEPQGTEVEIIIPKIFDYCL